jgi:hypothetical protein
MLEKPSRILKYKREDFTKIKIINITFLFDILKMTFAQPSRQS